MAQGNSPLAQGTPNASYSGNDPARPQARPTGDTSTGGGNGEEIKQQINTLRDDFGNLRTDLMSLLESLFEIGKGKTGAAKERMVESGKKAMDMTEAQIKERPLAAILIALIAGMILSTMMRKSGS